MSELSKEQNENQINNIEQAELPLNRIITLDDFLSRRDPEQGYSLMTGSFDALHVNHMQAILSVVRDSPDNSLIVAVDSDEWVQKRKGSMRPFYSFEIRALTVATIMEIGGLNGYVIQHHGDNIRLLEVVRPNLLMFSESKEERKSDIALTRAYGGEAKFLQRGSAMMNGQEVSTSNLTRIIASKLIEA